MTYRSQFHEKTYQDADGIYRFKSNGHIPFGDYLEQAGFDLETAARHVEARAAEDAEFFRQAREAERLNPTTPSEEELFEMRAAFGEGVEVVNVITGRMTIT